ncbi:G:T/U mismatch-specific uracil/thymine DNA-glycosylase [Alloactinosynnema sp. L-07]|uniref:G/U mismatch-specific DNA glycosylase n=1 Tax=Alloactinosynnema sp. L-07 TaxID=1653480 RepID=UPI00065F0264|nr:G/U mismatch-specific DNA glycosylase [Alloactinosynnema sp. L-07]CRK56364.1 G:T/U mismatch-specific uracil/thymine DNA-glycosylase [Alloactinosynnema sp. L-07]
MIEFWSHGWVSPPTREQLAAARDRTIPDVLGTDLTVLFCGINPSLYSAYTGHHFARPGNRFWPALHQSGFTPRLLRPAEQHLLPGFGLGLTNLVARATARADEVSQDELAAGGERLSALVEQYRPRTVAIVGVTAYRAAFGAREAVIGPQAAGLGSAELWMLPNPSGLNAHYQLGELAAEFRTLRERTR